MKFVSAEYNQELTDLADQLCTPERYSGILVVASEIETENLRGLWD